MAIAVLEDWFRIERALLDRPDGATLADLERVTGIPKGTLSRHLETAVEWSRVTRDDDGAKYRAHESWGLMHLHHYAHAKEIANARTERTTADARIAG